MWEWQVSNFEGGRPLLDTLALRIPAAPRAYLRQLTSKGRVRSGGAALAEGSVVAAGTPLTLPASTRLTELVGQGGIPPGELLYEDRTALVIFKPAGLATHRAPGHDDDLNSRVAHFLALRHAPYRAAPVHRLDIGTSGPLLFGKGRQAIGRFGQLLMDGRIHKHYLALIAGVTPPRGELTGEVPDGAIMRRALTRYRRLASGDGLTLLELDLVTGRPHQARRQLADAGWPIVGDRRYGGTAWPGLHRPFLHSHRLSFPDLDTGEEQQVTCPLPEPLTRFLAATGVIGAIPTDGSPQFIDAELPLEQV